MKDSIEKLVNMAAKADVERRYQTADTVTRVLASELARRVKVAYGPMDPTNEAPAPDTYSIDDAINNAIKAGQDFLMAHQYQPGNDELAASLHDPLLQVIEGPLKSGMQVQGYNTDPNLAADFAMRISEDLLDSMHADALPYIHSAIERLESDY